MLGHIHTRFASPADNIRYSGSPVKFNVKEARIKNKGKGVDIVTIDDDGISHEFKPLTPKTDLIVLEENWDTLCDEKFYSQQPLDSAWFAITIKNFDPSEHVHTNIRAKLQKHYKTIVELDYQVKANDNQLQTINTNINDLSPEETVDQFFKTITGKDLSNQQKTLVENIFNEVERAQK